VPQAVILPAGLPAKVVYYPNPWNYQLPEPSSLLLIASGLGCILIFTWQRLRPVKKQNMALPEQFSL
jgi:hypothetical protein